MDDCRCSQKATVSNTTSIIGDTRMWRTLEIVYMLRNYEFFSNRKSTTYDEFFSPEYEIIHKFMFMPSMEEFFKKASTSYDELFSPEYEIIHKYVFKSSIEEFFCVMSAFTQALSPKSLEVEDRRMWISLREMNQLKRDDFFSNMESFTSTKALTIAPSQALFPRDLFNMLSMLSWFKFDSKMKASTSTMAPTTEKDNKWSLTREVEEVFSTALKPFRGITEDCEMNWDQEYGVFQCDNVLNIWPKIRERNSRRNSRNYLGIERPKDVGEKIKDGLVKLNSPMILGEPIVHGVGFVSITLAGVWVAKKIHTMLRDGIDTWVPTQQFAIKRTIINSPSWDDSNLHPMDVLRRQCIIMSQMHMLECVKSAATTSSGNGMPLPPGELDKHFVIVEKPGEVLIYPKDKGNTKHIVRGKRREKFCLGEDSGCLGYPLEDLAALWHGLVNESADFILCVTPTQQQGYIQQCFDAAEHAGWTTYDNFWPIAAYVGFKTCSTSLEDLLSFLYTAPYPPSLDTEEAANLLGYSKEEVLDCALTYTFLKYHRLADCKFNYKEMLDVKGDTFVHLLLTLAQIRKITELHREDIDELKKASELEIELKLGVEKIWTLGGQRELGLHLLMFTDLITESYAAFFPHLLCGYLHDLSKKFMSFYENFVSLGFKTKIRLLLCEATAIVMEKGFHLLGITKIPSIKAVTMALVLSYVAPLDIRCPLKNPSIRTRFEMFTAYVIVTRDREFEDGELFGWINVSDYYGLLPDGCGRLHDPGPAHVSLISLDPCDFVKVSNNGRLEIGNPRSRHSVPFSSFMHMDVMLYATTESKDDLFEVCNIDDEIVDFSSFFDDSSAETIAEFTELHGHDGHIRIHYVLLRDALDSTIEVKLKGFLSRRVCGQILAFYGELDCGKEDLVENCYKAVLHESYEALTYGVVSLKRSSFAVPNKGSLVIEAHLTDLDTGNIIRDSCKFTCLRAGKFKEDIKNSFFILEVTISCS